MRQIQVVKIQFISLKIAQKNLAYSATLEVTDTNNCSDTYTFNNIQVFCLPDVEITSFDPVCQDDMSHLLILSLLMAIP